MNNGPPNLGFLSNLLIWENRKDIYLQKPTSLTVKEGRQLVNAVKKSNVILQVGTQQRAMPQFRIAAELVRNG